MFESIGNKRHASLRKVNAPAFAYAEVLTYETTVLEKVGLAVTKLKELMGDGQADMLKMWTFMTFDIISELSFGQSFQQLKQDEVRITVSCLCSLLTNVQEIELLRDLKNLLIIGGVNQEMPFVWPMLKMLAPFSARIKQLATVFDRLYDDYGRLAVENARKSLDKSSGYTKPTIFARMVASASEDPNNGPTPPIEIVARWAQGLTIAGTDTASVTLTYLIWNVLICPGVKKKLLDEIDNYPDSMSFGELSKLTYLNDVMNEALRIWPAAPGSLYRMAPDAGYTFDKYEVPGRTRVNTQAWTFHHDPTVFPDPEKFDPDRWLHPTPQMQEAFMPFGAGARICIGIQLAKMEMLHGTFAFFKACPDAVAISTEADMAPVDYFLIKPKAQQCLITLRRS